MRESIEGPNNLEIRQQWVTRSKALGKSRKMQSFCRPLFMLEGRSVGNSSSCVLHHMPFLNWLGKKNVIVDAGVSCLQ